MKLTKKPSLREKKRYIYFTVRSSGSLKYFDLKNTIHSSILHLIGELGAAKSNVHLVKNLWDQKKLCGVIRCSNKYVDQVKVSLALVHQIGEERVVFQTLRVSGTIKGSMSRHKK